MILVPGMRSRARLLGGRACSFFSCFLMSSMFNSLGFVQAAELSEREVVRAALSQPAYLVGTESRLAVAASAVSQAALWPNPSIGVSREAIGAAGGSGKESIVHITQAFDVAGRRTLRREAAEQRLEATKSDRDADRSRLVAEVRAAFAQALYRNRLRTALQDWSQRVDEGYRVVGLLAKAGEVSGYARRRLEREKYTVQARLARAEADYLRALEVLFGLIGANGAAGVVPVGELLPDPTPPLAAAQNALERRPELRSLVAQARAFEREQTAASRGWIPDVVVGAGRKRIQEPVGSDNGNLLTITVPIPLFDHGQAAQKRASAEAAVIQAEHALLLNRWRGELRGVWQQADRLRNAAVAFREDTATLSRELSRVAEASYRGGEATLLELLDAYRNELEAETNALDLALAAREARVELDHLSGAERYE